MKQAATLQTGSCRSRNSLCRLSTETKNALLKELQGPNNFLNELADIEDSHGVKACKEDVENETLDEIPLSEMESRMLIDAEQTNRLVL
eukprot:CAMPEP_0194201808 /NCGR_PEP_ID=MMETSP0156-20130528/1982_1 /TAXON_ID=33649 /ORGANISM="Thalassionema nitzschioides, Strain L26-B" /LENGTH=88 /DNA_ID=CAMNT_0038927103 /DNA_START=356 /DNA_END=622 /DNA_ORIENTATION=+